MIQKYLFPETSSTFTGFNQDNLAKKELLTLRGEKIFKAAHQTLVDEWIPEVDYQLGVAQGYCDDCCQTFRKLNKEFVVVQVGAFRHGTKVGLCFSCIFNFIQEGEKEEVSKLKGKTEESLIGQRKIGVPTIQFFFQDSNDIHQVNITVNGLKELTHRKGAIGILEPEMKLSEDHMKVITYILDHCGQLLKRAQRELEKPLACKKCKKIDMNCIRKNSLKSWNQARKSHEVAGPCLGCGYNYKRTTGCSVITCLSCISHTKTCLVCMDGAALRQHDLKTCSKLAEQADLLDTLDAQLDNFDSYDLTCYRSGTSLTAHSQNPLWDIKPLPPIQPCNCN